MRISDWSSDVCSSDLPEKGKHAHGQVDVEHPAPREIIGQPAAERGADDRPEDRAHAPDRHRRAVAFGRIDVEQDRLAHRHERRAENALDIGRASCRERVCQYVYISVIALSLKKNNCAFIYSINNNYNDP